MSLSVVSNLPLVMPVIKSLAVASNITSVAHAALRRMRVSSTGSDALRLLSTGASLWFFWQAPLVGLVAQVAINTLFDGANKLFSNQREKGLDNATSYNTNSLSGYLFKTVLFPLQMAERLHELAAPLPLPATLIGLVFYEELKFFQKTGMAEGLQPAHIFVNGAAIDAATVTLCPDSKRWIMIANGNGDLYQNRLLNDWKKHSMYWQLAHGIEANIIFFNYPGCGLSEGMASRSAMVYTHRAVQEYLEHQEKASEIISYGWSMGGGVQGEAMAGYTPKEGVRYVCIKDRTFKTLSEAARGIMGLIGALGAQLFGWNINTLADKHLPQIVMQVGTNGQAEHDGVISAKAALSSGISSAQVLWMSNIKQCEEADIETVIPHCKEVDTETVGKLSKLIQDQFAAFE